MTELLRNSTIACAIFFLTTLIGLWQSSTGSPTDAVRVNVTINSDGSRTVYEFDAAHRKATATTTESSGKPRSKIRYELDDAGRFASGLVFGPDGKFRFKSRYTYDNAGRIEEETQLGKDDTILNKIVYSYDAAGKQTGYSIFDQKGKLIRHVAAPSPNPTPNSRK
jgi:hypothetical protein